MTDVPSITSSLSSRRIDRIPPLLVPLVSLLLSFLQSPLRLVVAPLCLAIIALVLITQATPAQLVWRRTTYRDFNFPSVRATMTAPFPNPLIWRPAIKDLLGSADIMISNPGVSVGSVFIIHRSCDPTCQYLPDAKATIRLPRYLVRYVGRRY